MPAGIGRRNALFLIASMGALATVPKPCSAQAPAIATKPIPSSGELLPVVGLGSWITFNVGDDAELRNECATVIKAFFAAGGRLIDSSPMYGSAQETIGYGLGKLSRPPSLFAADKVWISDPRSGLEQIEQSQRLWGVPQFDLLQVHNLLSWEAHLQTLFEMKAAGQLKYVGITTSEGRRHADIEAIMRSRPVDFIQISYNVLDREVEQRILPLATERKIAVIANRPFRQGDLIAEIADQPLPDWVAETGARSWPQLLLKFIASHPAVTCAIPATSNVEHVRENMDAATGALMNPELRKRTIKYVESL
ncbi:diketogulonate reductase-like aldo/keto reductase [Rhizobium tibeticum]|uniref:aldo/keto reductase n=1 Tax=Rhizobium tibeticum TaxID=501024 RepID=UPI002783883C|nr:diketogulonate reductase-like aldo/keto reductase [Rhizobium tibeticum]